MPFRSFFFYKSLLLTDPTHQSVPLGIKNFEIAINETYLKMAIKMERLKQTL